MDSIPVLSFFFGTNGRVFLTFIVLTVLIGLAAEELPGITVRTKRVLHTIAAVAAIIAVAALIGPALGEWWPF